MSAKHSSGPWKVRNRIGKSAFKDSVSAADCVFAVDVTDPLFAFGKVGALVVGETGRARANARLIAAAPDLLEALEDIVEQFERTCFMVGADLAFSIRVVGKAAIRKAKGGAK